MMAALDFRVERLEGLAVACPGLPELHGLAGLTANLEAIAQEIEAELAGGAVGDVAAVGLGAVAVAHFLLEGADSQAHGAIGAYRSTRRRGGAR